MPVTKTIAPGYDSIDVLLPGSMGKAAKVLAKTDAKMAKLITQVGHLEVPLRGHSNVFGALCEAIVHQQLNGKAAQSIQGRLCGLYGSGKRLPKPEEILETTEEELRSVGLSRSKIMSLVDLSTKVVQGEIPTLAQAKKMVNQQVIDSLVAVRGIGKWSAEMFLIFTLARADVWPVDDFGVRKGFQILYDLDDIPRPADLMSIPMKWSPYRTVASLYLWQLANNPEVLKKRSKVS